MRRLFFAILLSVALHLVLVFALGVRASSGNDDVSVQSRWRRFDSILVVTGRAPAPALSPGEDLSRQRQPVRRTSAPAEAVPAIPLLPPVPGRAEEDGYHAASDLDLHPEPLGPIMVPPPVQLELEGRQGGVVLVLYIDALGQVARVDVESSTVPADVAEVAASTFRGAPMRPGEINGVPVPAKMKILVEYKSF